MKHKQCFKCGERKPLTEFYKHPQMPDGTVNKCKECNKLDVKKNRESKIEYYREYDRKRGNRWKDGYLAEYREKYPEKYKATNMVNNAVRDGRMSKPNYCQGCGDICNPHGHHENYSKPLDVTWLCAGCHRFIHVMRGD